MTEKDVLSYWLDTATDALLTAQQLFKLKRYHHLLFFCHLALEKILKGLIFKRTHSHALPIHDLVKLSEQAGFTLTSEQKELLAEITTWNIQARYDNIKREFYHKATKEFASKWLSKVKELFLWFKNQY